MELKDVILSTLAEIEELSVPSEAQHKPKAEPFAITPSFSDEPLQPMEEAKSFSKPSAVETVHSIRDDEARMLEGIRERLLVLFEGFQSPNNVQIEAKVDLTLNFLEYLLATIDNRLDVIKDT